MKIKHTIIIGVVLSMLFGLISPAIAGIFTGVDPGDVGQERGEIVPGITVDSILPPPECWPDLIIIIIYY